MSLRQRSSVLSMLSLLVLSALAACGSVDDRAAEVKNPDAGDTPEDPPPEISNLTTGSGSISTSDGHEHTYFFRVPGTAAPGPGRPVLIWLHGDGGTGEGLGSGFYPYTDPDGAVLVTPNGEGRSWSHAAGDLPGQAQDAQFLSRLIDELWTGTFHGAPIDPDRIYVGGESRGAYLPYYLLMRASTRDRLAAVAVNAGLLYCQAGDAECEEDVAPGAHGARSAILHLHGTNDTLVSPAPTASFHVPIDWNDDWRVFWPLNLWAREHGCFGGDNATLKDNGVLREAFSVRGRAAALYDLSAWGADCSKYQLLLVTDGGHVIAEQSQRIWSFLKGFSLSGA